MNTQQRFAEDSWKVQYARTAAEQKRAERYKELWRPAFVAAMYDPSATGLVGPDEEHARAKMEAALESAAIAAAKDPELNRRTDTGTALTINNFILVGASGIAVYKFVLTQLPFNILTFDLVGVSSLLVAAGTAVTPIVKRFWPGLGDWIGTILGPPAQT